MNSETTFGDRAAKVTRFLLLSAIVVVAALILAGPQHGLGNPLNVGAANAQGICAAPDYLTLTVSAVGNTDHLFIIDTNRHMILVYTMQGDQLLLVNARPFDSDNEILDGAVDVPGPNGGLLRHIIGGNGVTAAEARLFGEYQQKAFKEAEKNK